MNNLIPQLSCVVPVYNVESYLDECIESILSQSFVDFELLLVDDGSTDDSRVICEKYASQDGRIKCFHKSNGGVTSARKLGVEQAIGEYIIFVDSDDTLPKDSFGALIADCSDFDIVVGRLEHRIDKSELILSAPEFIAGLLESKILPSPCGRIIRRKLFTSKVFEIPPTILKGEDYLMNLRLACQAKYIKIINRRVYNYRIHPKSVTHTFVSTLAYEKLFDHYLIESLIDFEWKGKSDSILHQRIGALKTLILSKSVLDLNDDFVRKVKNNSNHLKGRLQLDELLVLKIHSLFVCRLLLRVHDKLKTIF